MSKLVPPHGGQLKSRYLTEGEVGAAKREAAQLPSLDLTPRQLCDVKLLLSGGFSPLEGFLDQAEYDSVLHHMRLTDGLLWPLPIVLDVSEAFADDLKEHDEIALRDQEGLIVAVMAVTAIYRPDRQQETKLVYGSADPYHPGIAHLLERSEPVYLGGRLTGVDRPAEYDFKHLRHEPAELRRLFQQRGWSRVVAFQTRNPMHRAHQELTYRAAQQAEANLLIHPVVGLTQPGDVDHFVRVRCYEHLMKHYPEQTTALSLLPLAMRMAGPREALWHAIIRKNYGCSHIVIGRDHAGPGADSAGKPFYGAYEAQDLVAGHQAELGIEMIPFKEMVYVQDRGQYVPSNEVSPEETVLRISGTEFRRRLRAGIPIPDWFSFPEVVAELRRSYPARHRQGFTVLFTGLSGAGKSTIANALMVKLMELGGRSVSLLDGDVVRKNLSSELGFSQEHRNLNVLRIGYVASEITKAGGIALCAPIAPYTAIRRQLRNMIEAYGAFIEVYVSTPIEVCEERDRKGFYAKARAGLIKHFTGIDDPYEVPEDPELDLDTRNQTADQAAQRIVLKLEAMGLIR